MRIAICDDDLSLDKQLRQFIHETYRDIDMLIDLYNSGEQFLNKISSSKIKYDLVLLDIEMNEVSGLKVATELKKTFPETYIVFITSHDEFALTGYEVSAFRFLVKPIQAPKLLEAIESVKKEILDKRTIQVQDMDRYTVLNVNDILYLEAQNKNVKIVLMDQSLYDKNGIDYYTQYLLSDDFYRVHRSYLINFNFITFIEKLNVQMANGDLIPISRLRKKLFDETFQSFVKRTAR